MEKLQYLTVIGAGAMGSAFARGVIEAGIVDAPRIKMVDVDPRRIQEAASRLRVVVSADAASAAKGADVILIAVKPATVDEVIRTIAEVITSKQLVVSIAAGVKLESVEKRLPAGTPVIRAMPNTPCRIGVGAIGFSRSSAADDGHVRLARSLFDAVGISVEVPEKLLDAVTGLSGSGPAYVFLMIEALSDAGVRVGLPRDTALKLAAQTVLGAAKMVLDEDAHPACLKDQVTSPGGTTITALDVLEKSGFRSALYEAVKAATERSKELGQ